MFLQWLQRNADHHGDALALVCGSEELTHTALLREVERVARGLLELGLPPGQRIALCLENCTEAIVALYATVVAGAVAVPLSPDSKRDELAALFEDAGVRAVVCDGPRVPVVAAVATGPARSIAIVATDTPSAAATDAAGPRTPTSSATPPNVTAFADLGGTAPLRYRHPDEDAYYFYSSGSTGRPKCVPYTHGQCWWASTNLINSMSLTSADRFFCALPLWHAYALGETLWAATASGGTHYLLEEPRPFLVRRVAALELLERARITIFPGVPFVFEQLVEAQHEADLGALRWCYSAAATLPRPVFDAFKARFGVAIRQNYGCTEAGRMTLHRAEDAVTTDTVGVACPGVEIRLLDADGEPVPQGGVGEIAVRSRVLTRGYLIGGRLSPQGFENGEFRTGDLGRFDAQGRLYLLGRRKHLIDLAGGYRVDPMEVEDVLVRHDAVAAAVVIGVPHPSTQETVVAAYVVCRRECSADALFAHCRERLSNTKVPKLIHAISDVPVDKMGKTIRRQQALDERKLRSTQGQEARG